MVIPALPRLYSSQLQAENFHTLDYRAVSDPATHALGGGQAYHAQQRAYRTMMLSPEEIAEQQQLLATHRRTLAVYIEQQAELGRAFSPPGVIQGIYEARSNIRRIKKILRSADAVIADDPDDEEPIKSIFVVDLREGTRKQQVILILSVAAVLLLLGVGIGIAFLGGARSRSMIQPTTRISGTTAVSLFSATSVAASPACFEQYFAGLPEDSIGKIDLGNPKRIGANQPTNAELGIQFTNPDGPIGAMRFRTFRTGASFNVETIVDANCQIIESYTSEQSPNKRIVPNFSSLKVRLGDQDYSIYMQYYTQESTVEVHIDKVGS
jgi:hypothetical protein